MLDWLQNIIAKAYAIQTTGIRCQRKNENAPSPLLQLPAELRNRIYHMCLPSNEPVHFWTNRVGQSWFAPLQVCRMMRKEASPIFYGNISFEVRYRGDYTGWIQRWLVSLPADTIFRRVRLELANKFFRCEPVESDDWWVWCMVAVDIDFRNTPPARVHLNSATSRRHRNYEWRDVGQVGQTGRLGSIVSRINGRDQGSGAFRQDLLDVSEIFKQIEEWDLRACAAFAEEISSLYGGS